MHFQYIPQGTCSRRIEFDIDNEGIVTNISFLGGCNGNLKGICALANGQHAADLIRQLQGLQCGAKGTSCPDQFACALSEAMKNQ